MGSAFRHPLGAILAAALLFGTVGAGATPAVPRKQAEASRATLAANKKTVQRYMEAFTRTDHPAILACLTDDVEWLIPGAFHIRGKKAFDREIENDAFVGKPEITVTRLTAEGDIVVAEGGVRSMRKDGGTLNLVFCDVFVLRGARIRKLTSYLVEVKK